MDIYKGKYKNYKVDIRMKSKFHEIS